MIKKISLFLFIIFFLNCQRAIKKEYFEFHNEMRVVEKMKEHLFDNQLTLEQSQTKFVLKIALNYNDQKVYDDEYWQIIMIELDISVKNNEHIKIPSEKIKAYGKWGNNDGVFKITDFSTVIEIIEKTENGVTIKIIDEMIGNIQYVTKSIPTVLFKKNQVLSFSLNEQ